MLKINKLVSIFDIHNIYTLHIFSNCKLNCKLKNSKLNLITWSQYLDTHQLNSMKTIHNLYFDKNV